MRIDRLESVDSTNLYLKRFLEKREDIAVFSDIQTNGMGTKGRSFLSDLGGVYFSVLTFYHELPTSEAFRIMAHAAVAVCRTAEHFGIEAEIKWPNDVRAAGKKLAGILIENGFRGDLIDHSIVGIGLNVRNDVSPLNGIAVSMKNLLSVPPRVVEVRNSLLENYLRPSTFEEYLSHVHFLGKQLQVTEGEEHYFAVARQVLPDGRLEVERDGMSRLLSDAEIALCPEVKR